MILTTGDFLCSNIFTLEPQAVQQVKQKCVQVLSSSSILVRLLGSDPVKLNSKNQVMGLFYLICIAVASFAVIAQPAFAQGANTALPLTYLGQVLQSVDNQTCPSEAQRETARDRVKTAMRRLLRESVIPLLPTFFCGGSTGWRRVAYLNMSDTSQQCPSVWQEITTPHRVCGRRSTGPSCEGTTYSAGSEQYDQVCGRIIGYQISTPDAFHESRHTVDNNYLDGVSVTYGSPRQHIWSFAGGLDEGNTFY